MRRVLLALLLIVCLFRPTWSIEWGAIYDKVATEVKTYADKSKKAEENKPPRRVASQPADTNANNDVDPAQLYQIHPELSPIIVKAASEAFPEGERPAILRSPMEVIITTTVQITGGMFYLSKVRVSGKIFHVAVRHAAPTDYTVVKVIIPKDPAAPVSANEF